MPSNSAVITLVLSLTLITTSCATREQAGALSGSLIGAALGSQIGKGSGRVATIFLGTVLGAEIGKAIGQHMDQFDHSQTINVLEHNKSHQLSRWRNPDTGHYYRVAPTRTYSASTGPCREFTLDAEVGGRTQQIYGTACRQANGDWKIIK
jgi:surface antigen